MIASLLADRYAHAMRRAVDGPDQLEEAAASIRSFCDLYESDPLLHHVLSNPVLDAKARVTVANTALTALATPQVVSRFIHLLIRRNRIGLLPEIARHIENHTAEWLNRVVVSVITATPLTQEMTARLEAAIEKFTSKTVVMKPTVDPDVIGGLVVSMWGMSFDFSLRTRLYDLRRKLLTEVELTYESEDTGR